MLKPQYGRMKRLAWDQRFQSPGLWPATRVHPLGATAPVHGIADDRMTDMGEVNPNLMGSSSLQRNAEQVTIIEPRNAMHRRSRGSAGRDDRHPLPVSRVAGDWRIDDLPVSLDVSPTECRVGPFDVVRRDRSGKPTM